MNRHSKLKPRVMERHNDGCGRLGADAGKTARDWTLIQVCRTIFDDGNKTHVYSILKYVGCQEEFLGFLGGQGFSKVRFLSGNDTNSGRPRCLPHFSYTCTAPNCILASDVKSVAKRPYSRLLKSPANVPLSLARPLRLRYAALSTGVLSFERRVTPMWSVLRDLFASVPPRQRAYLAVAVGCLLVGTLGLLAVLGLDLAPFWAILDGQ